MALVLGFFFEALILVPLVLLLPNHHFCRFLFQNTEICQKFLKIKFLCNPGWDQAPRTHVWSLKLFVEAHGNPKQSGDDETESEMETRQERNEESPRPRTKSKAYHKVVGSSGDIWKKCGQRWTVSWPSILNYPK